MWKNDNHFAGLQLNTVSIEGVKQLYRDRLGFPVVYESQDTVTFQPTPHFTLTFREVYEPISPVHIAFEVPYSAFDAVVRRIRKQELTIVKWTDGRVVDEFEGGKNVYFRDGDGNLLEVITHSYVKEDVLPSHGDLKVMYLREVGFPVNDVAGFREWLKSVLLLKTKEESDTFNFVVGGTAHAIVASASRRWIPIAMYALPPKMTVSFGVSEPGFIERVRAELQTSEVCEIVDDSNGSLHLRVYGYDIRLVPSTFDKEIPRRLQLPLSVGPVRHNR